MSMKKLAMLMLAKQRVKKYRCKPTFNPSGSAAFHFRPSLFFPLCFRYEFGQISNRLGRFLRGYRFFLTATSYTSFFACMMGVKHDYMERRLQGTFLAFPKVLNKSEKRQN